MGAVRGIVVLGVLASLLLAPASQGRSVRAGLASGEIVKVKWRRAPMPKGAGDFPHCHDDRFFTPGAAEVECRLTTDGHVAGCFVVSEQPWDCAYGKAALNLVKGFQASRRIADGRPIVAGMRVRIPVKFKMAD